MMWVVICMVPRLRMLEAWLDRLSRVPYMVVQWSRDRFVFLLICSVAPLSSYLRISPVSHPRFFWKRPRFRWLSKSIARTIVIGYLRASMMVFSVSWMFSWCLGWLVVLVWYLVVLVWNLVELVALRW